MYICVRVMDLACVSTIFTLHFATVLTMLYCYFI